MANWLDELSFLLDNLRWQVVAVVFLIVGATIVGVIVGINRDLTAHKSTQLQLEDAHIDTIEDPKHHVLCYVLRKDQHGDVALSCVQLEAVGQ